MPCSGDNNNLDYKIFIVRTPVRLEQGKLVFVRGTLAEVVDKAIVLCFHLLDVLSSTFCPTSYKM